MTKPKSIYLQDNTWQEIEEYLKDESIIIIPIGATEQHGPAGALGLDTYNALHLAEDVAKINNIMLTPPIWFGDSSHHTAFPGTISIQSETQIRYLKDVMRSLLKHGFKKIVFINGHKIANLPTITIAAKDIHEYEYPNSIISIADPWKIARGIAKDLKNGVAEHHAGILEMSQLEYKRPDLVRKDNLSDVDLDFEASFSKWSSEDLFGNPINSDGNSIDIVWNSNDQKKFTSTGQFSDNRNTSSEIGQEYHNYMVDILNEFIVWLKAKNI